MVISVNTNSGAMIALQNLNATNKLLEQTQLNITTGFRVNGPKDDASTFAIAQNMRGKIAGMSAVKTALANGESTINVAITGGRAISDLMIQMKAKVVQANQAGLDAQSRSALENDFNILRQQIDTIVSTADFNGQNMINSGASNLSILSTVDGSSITVSAQNLSPTGLSINTLSLVTTGSANAALTAINSALDLVSQRLTFLGAGAKRIEIQNEFTTKLMDILKEGVGNLVDADLAEESAKLQALQVKQQLGVQALGIANSNPQSILQLFQG